MIGAGAVVWLTGPPAAGKSTLAAALAVALRARGLPTLVLDGDDVRAALVPTPGYDDAGRDSFYRSLIGLGVLAAAQGLMVVIPATAHRRAWRELARARAPRFVEVHVATPLALCRARDPKGLYAAAGPGSTLPGAALAYEPPLAPEVIATPGAEAQAIDAVLAALAD